jgi:hypothetical protein
MLRARTYRSGMTRRKPARTRLRPPTADELDAYVATHDDLPWLAACWVERTGPSRDEIRWSLDRATAPSCARTHLLAGRRAFAA